MGTFTNCCPHCGAKVDVQDEYYARDEVPSFEFDCLTCDQTIRVQAVHVTTEFELSK